MEYRQVNGTSFLAAEWPLSPDKPTLIFIHGAASTALFWESQLKGMGDRANAVAIDLPGRERGEGKTDIAAYAEAAKEFAERLKIPRPVPCGLSMGGAVVQSLLLNYPDTFHAGVIVNSGARLKTAPIIFEMIKKDYGQFGELIYQWAVYEKNRSDRLWKAILRSSSDNPETALENFKACHSFDLMKELGDVQARVLILAAEEDKLTPLKYSEFLERNIKNSRLVVIKKAGHFSPLEKPEEVNEALREFVSDL